MDSQTPSHNSARPSGNSRRPGTGGSTGGGWGQGRTLGRGGGGGGFMSMTDITGSEWSGKLRADIQLQRLMLHEHHHVVAGHVGRGVGMFI